MTRNEKCVLLIVQKRNDKIELTENYEWGLSGSFSNERKVFMKKRLLTVVLIALLGISTLAGCGSQGNRQTQDAESETSDTAFGEKVNLTALLVKHSLTKDVNEMQWMTNLEERMGVAIEWQQITSDWDQKKNALFASGDIPDILFSAASDTDYVQFNGLFEDMGPLIEQYCPNIQELFNTYPDIKYLCSDMDGHIYSLPRLDGKFEDGRCIGTMYINQVWLDNLNLEVPSTWDELEQVLIAFKEQDANGNGDPNDEIPMDFSGIGSDYGPVNLLGGLGVPLTNWYTNGFFVEDGQVKCWYVDERFQTLLVFLQKLYSRGLINEETFTADYSQFQSTARGEGDKAKVGFTWGWSRADRFGDELSTQYVAIPPMKVSADFSDEQLYYLNAQSHYGKNVISLSTKCKNKEAAMRFLDELYDVETSLEVAFGGMNDVDGCIQKNEDGSYEVLPPKDSSVDDGSWKWTNAFCNNGGFWIRKELDFSGPASDMEALEEKSIYLPWQTNMPDDSVYKQDMMKYSEEDQNTLSMDETNMANIWNQQCAQWIVGSDDIVAGWDTYVNSIENAGLAEDLEIRQKAYDSFMEFLNN